MASQYPARFTSFAFAAKTALDRLTVPLPRNPLRDGYVCPFSSHIEAGLVFYPTYGYWLDPEQFVALRATDIECGGSGKAVLQLTEVPGSTSEQARPSWIIYLNTFEEYVEQCRGLGSTENFQVSLDGKWATWFSMEYFAFFGGTAEFTHRLAARILNLNEQAIDVLQLWKWTPPQERQWVCDTYRLLFGNDHAEEMFNSVFKNDPVA